MRTWMFSLVLQLRMLPIIATLNRDLITNIILLVKNKTYFLLLRPVFQVVTLAPSSFNLRQSRYPTLRRQNEAVGVIVYFLSIFAKGKSEE